MAIINRIGMPSPGGEPTTERLTLTDFDLLGVNVVPGINDAVANIVVTTLAGYTGSLTLVVDSDFLVLDTPDFIFTPVTEFSMIQADTVAAGPVTVRAIPEPGTLIGLMLMGLIAGVRRRRSSRPITGMGGLPVLGSNERKGWN